MAASKFDADELAKLRRMKAEDDRKHAQRLSEARSRGLPVPELEGQRRPYLARLKELEQLEREMFEGGGVGNSSAMRIVLVYWLAGALAVGGALYWWLH